MTFVNATPDSRVLTSTFEGFGTTTIPAGASHQYVAVVPGIIAYRFGTARTDRGTLVVQRQGSLTLAAGLRTVTFGQALTLSGRAAPAGFPVSIEERLRDGSGWKEVTTVMPDGRRRHSAKVRPALGAQYRASLFNGVIRSPRVSVTVKAEHPAGFLRPRDADGTDRQSPRLACPERTQRHGRRSSSTTPVESAGARSRPSGSQMAVH